MSKRTTETVMLLVPVRVTYSTTKAKRAILAELKRELFSEWSSCGEHGHATAKTLRPKWAKPNGKVTGPL